MLYTSPALCRHVIKRNPFRSKPPNLATLPVPPIRFRWGEPVQIYSDTKNKSTSNGVHIINSCIHSLSRIVSFCVQSCALTKKPDCCIPHHYSTQAIMSASLSPLFLCVLPSVYATSHCWLDLSSFHQVDSALLVCCCRARRSCWIMQMVIELQSSLETTETNCSVHVENSKNKKKNQTLYSFLEKPCKGC